MLFFFEVFGRNEIHFFTVIILGVISFIAVIFYIMVLTAVAFAIAVAGEDVFSNAVIKTHEISAFLVWGQSVIYGDILSGFFEKERDFCLILTVPVGEVIAILGKLLCEEGFCACSAGGAFFTGQELVGRKF